MNKKNHVKFRENVVLSLSLYIYIYIYMGKEETQLGSSKECQRDIGLKGRKTNSVNGEAGSNGQ